jgi:hypothetical protein
MAVSPLHWFMSLDQLKAFLWASTDESGSIGLVCTAKIAPSRTQLNKWLRFARAVAVFAEDQLIIWRKESVTQIPLSELSVNSELVRHTFGASARADPSVADCERALIALHETSAGCFDSHTLPGFWLHDVLLSQESGLHQSNSMHRNACFWVNCWKKASNLESRPAAFASTVYARLAYRLDRSGQGKRRAWFTPKPVADFLADAVCFLLSQMQPQACTVLEPAAGFGGLAEALLLRWNSSLPALNLTAIESDASSAEVCRQALHLYSNADVRHENWLVERKLVDDWLLRQHSQLSNGHLVVLANPPWSGISDHMDSWLQDLLMDYKCPDGLPLTEKKHWLCDEYVKFIRLAQYLFEQSQSSGILALVCSHSWLDNPTFRGLRHSLVRQFAQIYLIDLHGSKLKQEAVPESRTDDNIFGIRQGACLLLAMKSDTHPHGVFWSECWGTVDEKLEQLRSCSFRDWPWQALNPAPPDWQLIPRPSRSNQQKALITPLTELFQVYGSAIVSARDRFAFADRPDTLIERVEVLRSSAFSDEELATNWGLRPTSSFNLAQSRERLRQIPSQELAGFVRPILYRPFWWRYVFYHDAVVERRVYRLMQHLERPNIALVTVRRSPAGLPAGYYLATQDLVSQGCIRADNQSIDYVFPLWRYEWPQGLEEANAEPFRVPNLRTEALLLPEQLYGQRLNPEDVFGYVYALAWSPAFRQVYAHDLREQFMRLAWVPEVDLFTQLAKLGNKLALVHASRLELPRLPMQQADSDSLNGRNRRVKAHFNSEPCIDNLYIGSYPVLDYWMKKHQAVMGHDPHFIELAYNEVVTRLQTTLEIQSELERLVPESYWMNQ